MITRRDFDAAAFPDLRAQLKRASDACHHGVGSAWSAKKRDERAKTLVARDCPLCGASRSSSDRIVTKHGMDVASCRNCSLVYTTSVSRSAAALLTFTDPGASSSFIARQEETAYRQLARTKHEYFLQEAGRVTTPGPLLDIGCCTGDFMEAARGRGWSPAGIEASEHFASIARSRGFAVRTGLFPDTVAPRPHESYQAITMLDVLEHLADPVAALRALRSHLGRSGILVIQVPNFDSPLMALEGAANRNYSLTHWSHFTRRTLSATAAKAGFKPRRLETVITELDVILQHPRDAIDRAIRESIGNGVTIPATIDAEWLHEHFLGFKLFGLFALA